MESIKDEFSFAVQNYKEGNVTTSNGPMILKVVQAMDVEVVVLELGDDEVMDMGMKLLDPNSVFMRAHCPERSMLRSLFQVLESNDSSSMACV